MPSWNDPLYSDQWYLENNYGPLDINVTAVWDELGISGSGVIVGVMEGGAVQNTHSDLVANYNLDADYDGYTRSTVVPSSMIQDHATSVAGIIAATANNGEGTVGVAWGSTVASYNIGYDFQSNGSFSVSFLDYYYAMLYSVTAGVDILNNSWGTSVPYGFDFNSNASYVDAGLNYVIENGRDGLGTIVVKSAGNSRGYDDWANSSDLTNSPYTIAVAALSADGGPAYYSSSGVNVFVTAPSSDNANAAYPNQSGMTTTDLTGSDGYSSGDYTDDFGGTSASAPVVSGVIALMLEANPDLGYRDVQDILAATSRRSVLTPSHADFAFVESATNSWNGGGYLHSADFGFGLVDALAAVRLASVWKDQQTLSNNAQFSVSSQSVIQPINDNSTTSQSLYTSNDISIEFVEISLDLDHTYTGDIEITLISPNGTRSMIKPDMLNSEGNFGGSADFPGQSFTFSSAQFWGESSFGTWTVEVTDVLAGFTGTLRDFTLTFHGEAAANDDDYIFTDDYAYYASLDSSRASLSDTSGTDEIILAALSSGAVLNLNPGALSTIAGAQFQISSSSTIENIEGTFFGDTLTGNTVANVIYSGSGDDYVWGGAGADFIDGADGTDTLSGDDGADQIYGQGGNDFLYGNNGDDLVFGGAGNDGINGGEGGDTLYCGADNDYVNGNQGNDFLYGESGDDVLFGEDGNDGINCGDGADTAYAGTGDDYVSGNAGNDFLYGESGNDILFGNEGNDGINGGDGVDTIYSGSGSDYVSGDAGSDFLYGESGDDILFGNDGNDGINGGDGVDTIYSGTGDDYVSGDAGSDFLYGESGNDILFGNDGNDGINGGDGTDTVYCGVGNDYVNGNSGSDFLYGESGDDYLFGGTGNDGIVGGSGDDQVSGEDGNDYLVGGSGTNTIAGGDGADVFVFEFETETTSSTITDFEVGIDMVLLLGVEIQSANDVAGDAVLQLTDSSTLLFTGQTVSDLNLDPDYYVIV